ncbi:MAG: hypothetical protein ACXWA3_12555, partial [Acidimicrobiales bacterium]
IRPATTSQSFVWADMPSPPPDGATVVAVDPGISCWGAVVVGAAVVAVVDGASVEVVVDFLGVVVVVVDLGFVVVVVGFLVVVVARLVVVLAAVVVVEGAVVSVVVGSTWPIAWGPVDGVWAEPGTTKATSRATTTAAAATAIDLRRTVRC